MGRGTDGFSSGSERSRIVNGGRGFSQAQTYQPEEFVDREELEKLFLGVDFLNYLALKLLVVALICLVSIEVV
jgi:hypothetical protein